MATTLMIFATSCKDDDEVAKYYDLGVSLQLPADVTITDITSASVVVTNDQTGVQYSSTEVKTDYQFSIQGGSYAVTVALRSNDGVSLTAYNGSKNVTVYEDQDITIELAKSETSGLVFKEVYYNMVRPNGKTPYLRDQFYEIYNNSDEIFYLDNCVFGILEGTQGILPTSWMQDNEIMKEYALGYYVTAFIGSGTDYPVAPGHSVVIASQAQNHTAETASAYNPEVDGAMQSPVDLTNADYEICLNDYKPNYAIDNPDVPNMSIIYAVGTNNYFMVPATGNAIILAKLPAGTDPIAYAQDEANLKERPDGTYAGTKYLMIPQEYVLDGINIVNNDESKRVVRLRSEVDAGMVWMEKQYGGKSIRRKVERITDDGRTIFKDTNNSSDDFLTDQIPTPGIIPTTVD